MVLVDIFYSKKWTVCSACPSSEIQELKKEVASKKVKEREEKFGSFWCLAEGISHPKRERGGV